MPKRNLVLLFLIAVACLLAWAARDRGGRARLYGEVTGHVGRMALEPVDDEALFHAAMEGMFARLDEHSSFEAVDPRSGAPLAVAAEFAGVGLELVAEGRGRLPTVITPLVSSPAWRAGIAAGDRIVAIDGIVENSLIKGVATEAAIDSGEAPGSCAVTEMVGKSTVGRAATGRKR